MQKLIDKSYIRQMARGWESKSVESHQEEVAASTISQKPRLTRKEADQAREIEGLRLTLRRIVADLDLAKNALRREMLENARLEIKNKIEALGH